MASAERPAGAQRSALAGRLSARPWLLIAALAFLFMAPAPFVRGVYTGDAQIHWRWQLYHSQQFWSGDWLPRWLIDLNDGFGSPAFFAYAPALQWLTSLLRPLLPGADQIPLRFTIILFALLALSGIGAWQWLRRAVRDREAALFGAALYMLLPYHAYVNTYQRGAFAELAAMAAAPWALYGIERLRAPDWRGFPAYVAGVAGIFVSHAPSSVMVLPFVAAYGLAVASWDRNVQPLIKAAAGGLLALLLAAFYLVPAFALMPLLGMSTLFGSYFDPARWLIFGGPWFDSGMQLVITSISALYLGLSLVFGAIALRIRSREHRRLLVLMAGFAAVVALLMIKPSQVFWNLDTIVSKIQFPWRLLSVATLAVAALGALAFRAVSAFDAPARPWLRTLALLLIPGLLLANAAMLALRLEMAERRGRLPETLEQALGRGRDQREYQLGELDRLNRRFGEARAIALAGDARFATLAWEPRAISLLVDSAGGTAAAVRQLDFSGWRYRVDSGPWRRAGTLSAEEPVPVVAVPAGRHRIDLELVATRAERAGSALSLVGLVLFAGACLAIRARRRASGES